MSDPFASLPRGHFKAILADPPWAYKAYSGDTIPSRASRNGLASAHYQTMPIRDICALPVQELAAPDCALFVWVTWPTLLDALTLIEVWGFTYKTCAFSWMKADVSTINLFDDPVDAYMGLGYWTRANSEVCLLATRGKPARMSKSVRQGIIEPRREHSRKPDCTHDRIQQLVEGPYLELFARTERPAGPLGATKQTSSNCEMSHDLHHYTDGGRELVMGVALRFAPGRSAGLRPEPATRFRPCRAAVANAGARS